MNTTSELEVQTSSEGEEKTNQENKRYITSEGETQKLVQREIPDNTHVIPIDETNLCNNLHRINKMQDIIHYLHAAAFSPPKSTFIRTIKRNHFMT